MQKWVLVVPQLMPSWGTWGLWLQGGTVASCCAVFNVVVGRSSVGSHQLCRKTYRSDWSFDYLVSGQCFDPGVKTEEFLGAEFSSESTLKPTIFLYIFLYFWLFRGPTVNETCPLCLFSWRRLFTVLLSTACLASAPSVHRYHKDTSG